MISVFFFVSTNDLIKVIVQFKEIKFIVITSKEIPNFKIILALGEKFRKIGHKFEIIGHQKLFFEETHIKNWTQFVSSSTLGCSRTG
jgi:hypothetical protein